MKDRRVRTAMRNTGSTSAHSTVSEPSGYTFSWQKLGAAPDLLIFLHTA